MIFNFLSLSQQRDNNFGINVVATSDSGMFARILELIIRIEEKIFGNGQTDILHHGLLLNIILFNYYSRQSGIKTLLFDLENDPEEKIDISDTHPKVLKDMMEAMQLQMVI